MGIGTAKNILAAGFDLVGHDLRDERLQMLTSLVGKAAANLKAVGENADVVFVMVLNGKQALDVVASDYGLLQTLH